LETPEPSLSVRLLRLYDEKLRHEQSVERQFYYRSSRDKYRALVDAIDGHGSCVLEIGPSELSALLKTLQPDWRVTALSLDAGWRSNWFPEVEVAVTAGDILTTNHALADEMFDVVLFSEVIEHLQGNPRLALTEIARLLRPGGRVVLTTPNLARLANRLKLLAGYTPLERIGRPGTWGGHFREYTRSEIVDMCSQAGLIVEWAGYPLYWDGLKFYLENSGTRGYDESGTYRASLRYVGWRRVVAMPFLLAISALTRQFPSLRTGMLVVARKPWSTAATVDERWR
jgi:SAM-dependent methyltransferase